MILHFSNMSSLLSTNYTSKVWRENKWEGRDQMNNARKGTAAIWAQQLLPRVQIIEDETTEDVVRSV